MPEPKKCSLIQSKAEPPAHGVRAEGVEMDPAEVEVVEKWPVGSSLQSAS